jgi:cold shock protein
LPPGSVAPRSVAARSAAPQQLLLVDAAADDRPIAIAGTGGNVQVGRATAIDTLEMVMATGTVKWFNPTKGYGFIQPQSGGQDVFVHISAVEKAGLATLNEGQQVEFEIVSNRGKSSAENLKLR